MRRHRTVRRAHQRGRGPDSVNLGTQRLVVAGQADQLARAAQMAARVQTSWSRFGAVRSMPCPAPLITFRLLIRR